MQKYVEKKNNPIAYVFNENTALDIVRVLRGMGYSLHLRLSNATSTLEVDVGGYSPIFTTGDIVGVSDNLVGKRTRREIINNYNQSGDLFYRKETRVSAIQVTPENITEVLTLPINTQCIDSLRVHLFNDSSFNVEICVGCYDDEQHVFERQWIVIHDNKDVQIMDNEKFTATYIPDTEYSFPIKYYPEDIDDSLLDV